jgi:hypothetical protein
MTSSKVRIDRLGEVVDGRPAGWSAALTRPVRPRSSTVGVLLATVTAIVGSLVLLGVLGAGAPPGPTDDGTTPVASADRGAAGSDELPAPPDPPTAPAPTATPDLPEPEPRPTADTVLPDAARPQTALTTVPLLEVKGRAPRTGYDRDLFGSGWVDVDRNGCDTRNDMLARDLTGTTFKAGTHDCVVLTGTLVDPFSGATIAFQRGNDTSNDVQIDHVVALSDAWQKGAQGWDEPMRVAFANDPLNLLAVDGPLNMQKGDGDAATWLPPNKPFRCAYVARQVAVKHAYGLWVTAAERDAMAGVLAECPAEPLPDGAE